MLRRRPFCPAIAPPAKPADSWDVCAESFGERKQRKRVLILDKNFVVVDEIEMSVGPQHHQLHWLTDAAYRKGMNLDSKDRVKLVVPHAHHEEAVAWKSSVKSTGVPPACVAVREAWHGTVECVYQALLLIDVALSLWCALSARCDLGHWLWSCSQCHDAPNQASLYPNRVSMQTLCILHRLSLFSTSIPVCQRGC
jgi:hypothetical protein